MNSQAEPINRPLAMETAPCNLCGADDARFLYEKPDSRYWLTDQVFQVVQCRRCSLAYLNPRPTPGDIGRCYPSKFYAHREHEKNRERYETQAAFLADLRPGRLLDVGCATGTFLHHMAEKGWEAHGTDRAEVPNPHSLAIRHGDLLDLRYPDEHFDVVTSWAVFEHLHDPMKYFREVRRILRPGGRFVCLVTNIKSIWSRYSYCEDIPRHLYFFSEESLQRYGKETGLALIRLEHTDDIVKVDTTDVFRMQLLLRLGYTMREINDFRPLRSRWHTMMTHVASRLGSTFFSGRLEKRLRMSGIITGVFEKRVLTPPESGR